MLRDPSRPWGKDNYWTINPNSEYTFADGLFRRRRKKLLKADASKSTQPSASKFTGPFTIENILAHDKDKAKPGTRPESPGFEQNTAECVHNSEQMNNGKERQQQSTSTPYYNPWLGTGYSMYMWNYYYSTALSQSQWLSSAYGMQR